MLTCIVLGGAIAFAVNPYTLLVVVVAIALALAYSAIFTKPSPQPQIADVRDDVALRARA